MYRCGRGYGKTYTGAHHTSIFALSYPGVEFGVIARTHDDLMQTIFRENLLEIIPDNCIHGGSGRGFNAQAKTLTLTNGSIIRGFTGQRPDGLRGPNLNGFWADELPAWQYPQETWDNAKMATRKAPGGNLPELIMVTTTPRPIQLIKELCADDDTHVIVGSTYENKDNLSARFLRDMEKNYEGTRLGRQELHADILEDIGALWTLERIDAKRIKGHIDRHGRLVEPDLPEFDRIVVAVDPAVTGNHDSDETGIVVAARKGERYFILDDQSLQGSTDQWAQAAVHAYHYWQADCMVAETNNGGDLVKANLKATRSFDGISYQAVTASRGKKIRAEAPSMLYEQGKVHHVGVFAKLEDQMTNFTGHKTDKSPDRMDALVWALTNLMESGNDDDYIGGWVS